jgi:PAS domain S-box-containing protein
MAIDCSFITDLFPVRTLVELFDTPELRNRAGVGMNECEVESPAEVVLDANEKIRVLHVDDDSGFLKLIKQCLEIDWPFQVDQCLSVDEALAKLDEEKYDVIVSDYQMPGKDGLQFLRELREKGSRVPFIMFTGKGREEVAIEALNLGAKHYINKTGEAEVVYTELAHSITELANAEKAEEKAEKASEEARVRFKNIADIAGDWVWEVDGDGRYTYSNPSVEQVLGYVPEEVLGRHFYDFYPAEEQERLKEVDMKIFARKERFTTFVHKDGHLVVVETRGIPVVTPDGKILGYRGSDRDVTETKQAQKALKESEEKFKQLFTQNPEATCYLDADLHILDVNPRFRELFGYTLEEAKGKNIDDIIVPEGKMEEARMLEEKALGRYVYFDTVRKRKDGLLIPVSVSAAPMKIIDELAGYVVIYKDISEMKKAEEELKVAMEKLCVVGSLTRHDIRNKLAAVDGYLFLLRKKLGRNMEALENLNEIGSSSQQILRILEFSRVYEQLGAEELKYVNVEECVNDAAATFTNLKNVKVKNSCRGLQVLADSLLTQVFYNLIDNTLKYGEKTTLIRFHYEKLDGNHLKLIYEDDGVGIPDQMRSSLFQKGCGKGTGYGLYLIKRICKSYGWTLQETGKQGEGAQFTMTIPQVSKDNTRIQYTID